MVKRTVQKRIVAFVKKVSGKSTILVAVKARKMHARYKKVINETKTYLVHDETNLTKIGDKVEIVETRPLSKQKRWRLARVIESVRIDHQGELL